MPGGGVSGETSGLFVGRPPKKPVVRYHEFMYQAASWDKARRVVAKVETG